MADTAPVAPAAPAAPPAPAETPVPAAPDASAAPAAPAAGAIPEAGSGPGSAAKRLFKLTVDGQTEEYDASDDKRVAADLQKGRHAAKQAADLARKWSVVEKAMEEARANPAKGLAEIAQALGLDPRKASQDLVAEELRRQIREDELAQMSPEERQAFQDREELARLRAEAKQRADDEKQAEEQKTLQARQAKIAENLDKAIQYGLEGTKLAGDPYAQYMFAAVVQGAVEDVLAGRLDKMPHPKQIAGWVEANINRLASKYVSAPPAAPPAPAKPTHPAARHTKTPGKATTARDPKTGQFTNLTYGTTIYERLAETAEKSPRRLHFNPVPKALP